MNKSRTLKLMMLVAGGLTAATAMPSAARANCGGSYRPSPGSDSGSFDRGTRETDEQREARVAAARVRREARRLARIEARAAEQAAAAERAAARQAAATATATGASADAATDGR